MDLNRTIKLLKKPEYLFRPMQILRRLRLERNPRGRRRVVLPWGLPLNVWADETIGSSIVKTGVHDLATTELIFRLLDPGDRAVDGGANVGFMTCAMLVRVGAEGKVYAFEAHPEVYEELLENIFAWGDRLDNSPVTAYQVALSDQEGEATLHIPVSFKGNRGLAYLGAGVRGEEEAVASLRVPAATLAGIIGEERQIKLLKLDVEGHELAVLEGADALLRKRRITHILFEEHLPLPTAATDFLQNLGYALFKFEKGFVRPKVVPALPGQPHRSFESPSYLATLEPAVALSRLKGKGWRSLAGRRPRRSYPSG